MNVKSSLNKETSRYTVVYILGCNRFVGRRMGMCGCTRIQPRGLLWLVHHTLYRGTTTWEVGTFSCIHVCNCFTHNRSPCCKNRRNKITIVYAENFEYFDVSQVTNFSSAVLYVNRDCPSSHCRCWRTDRRLSRAEEQRLLQPVRQPTNSRPRPAAATPVVDNVNWKRQANIRSRPVSSSRYIQTNV